MHIYSALLRLAQLNWQRKPSHLHEVAVVHCSHNTEASSLYCNNLPSASYKTWLEKKKPLRGKTLVMCLSMLLLDIYAWRYIYIFEYMSLPAISKQFSEGSEDLIRTDKDSTVSRFLITDHKGSNSFFLKRWSRMECRQEPGPPLRVCSVKVIPSSSSVTAQAVSCLLAVSVAIPNWD